MLFLFKLLFALFSEKTPGHQGSLFCCCFEGKHPYKRILVHGFAVDENKKKMSKSVGNVIDPDVVRMFYDLLLSLLIAYSSRTTNFREMSEKRKYIFPRFLRYKDYLRVIIMSNYEEFIIRASSNAVVLEREGGGGRI